MVRGRSVRDVVRNVSSNYANEVFRDLRILAPKIASGSLVLRRPRHRERTIVRRRLF